MSRRRGGLSYQDLGLEEINAMPDFLFLSHLFSLGIAFISGERLERISPLILLLMFMKERYEKKNEGELRVIAWHIISESQA